MSELPIAWLQSRLAEHVGQATAEQLMTEYFVRLSDFIAEEDRHLAEHGATDATPAQLFEYIQALLDLINQVTKQSYLNGLRAGLHQAPASRGRAARSRTDRWRFEQRP